MLAFKLLWLIGGVMFAVVGSRVLYKERSNPTTTITNSDALGAALVTFVPLANLSASAIWFIEYNEYFRLSVPWMSKSWYKGERS